MEGWSPQGVHYLHIAYAAIFATNMMYAAWLAYRWARTSKGLRGAEGSHSGKAGR